MVVVRVRRFLPLALAGILVGLPLMADGVRNPPTAEEVRSIGQASPTVARYMDHGQLLGVQIVHVDFFQLGQRRGWVPGGPGDLSGQSGVWELHWTFSVPGHTVTVDQVIGDRTGQVLQEDVNQG